MSFDILVGSTCDISTGIMEKYDIGCIPMGGILNDYSYKHYADYRELAYDEFYARLRAGEAPSTSAINIGEWSEAMEECIGRGNDVLVVAFSSALSCTYPNAKLAAEEVMAKCDKKVVVIDTLCASLGETLLAIKAAKMRADGAGLEETAKAICEAMPNMAHWFTVDDLHHLHRGGRISGASAMVGSALGIKPILHVDDEGKLINVGKARGQKKALSMIVDKVASTSTDDDIFIGHADDIATAETLKEMILAKKASANIEIYPLGPIVAGHTGANMVAAFFLASER